MSKQRKNNGPETEIDPSLARASALVQEYTGKLRAISRRIHDVRKEYGAALQRRLEQVSTTRNDSGNHAPQEQQLWFEVVEGFRLRHTEYTDYLRALFPQAKKLAQHLSQLITHGTDETLVKIELSLRVAELESAIETARKLASSHSTFNGF